MGILSIIAQLFLALTILITLHEAGHFFAARAFGNRVHKFYLFFDFLFPFPDKMNFALWKKKIGDTEYGIGWFPMGGYVAIAGMEDETQDAPDPDAPIQDWDYRARKKWQKLIIMLGGVIVNFILGFLIYSMVLWVWGTDKLPMTEIQENGIAVDELGKELGLKDGDYILKVGDRPLQYLNGGIIRQELGLNEQETFTVIRDGQEKTFTVPKEAKDKVMTYAYRKAVLVEPRVPYVIGEITEGSAAEKAGLKENDNIVSIDGKPVNFKDEFFEEFKSVKDTAYTVGYIRDKDSTVLTTKLELGKNGKMGIRSKSQSYFFDLEHKDYGFIESFPAGFSEGADFIVTQFVAFGQMFKGNIKVTESLGGFGAIGGLFDPSWNWKRFWQITGMLSLILAIMNLLPIPMLDGGYVLFLLFEMITGKEIPEKVMNVLLNIGLIMVLFLMVFANGMDIWRAIAG